MKLTVKNIGPIRAAEIDIDGLTVLVGHNEAGKTTLLNSVAGLLRYGSAAFAKTKKGLKAVVTDDATDGACHLTNGSGGWEASLVLPEGVRAEVNARQGPQVSEISLGLPFTSLKPEQRSKLLQAVLGVKVKGQDILDALKPLGIEGDAAGVLLGNLKDLGWDALERRYREDSTKKKGAWENTTSTRYGSDKAATWQPETTLFTETVRDADIVDLMEAADIAGKTLDALKAATAVSTHDHEALEAAAAKLPALEAAEAAAHAAHELADKAMSDKQAELAALGDPTQVGIPCPHCGKPLKLDTSERHAIKVIGLPVTTDLNARELQDLRHKRAGVEGEVSRVRAQQGISWNTFVDAAAAVKAAKKAREQLANGGEGASEDATAELNKAQGDYQIADALWKLRQTYDKAQELHKAAVLALAIADLLAPSGLRQKAMDVRIRGFNSELGYLSQTAGMDDAVEITPDLDVQRGTRPYERLSRGARFAVDIVLQLALAKRAGDVLLVIDDFEMLVGQHRTGILKTLAASQVPALLAVAAKEVGNLQNIVNAGLGRVYEVSGGSTREIERSAA